MTFRTIADVVYYHDDTSSSARTAHLLAICAACVRMTSVVPWRAWRGAFSQESENGALILGDGSLLVLYLFDLEELCTKQSSGDVNVHLNGVEFCGGLWIAGRPYRPGSSESCVNEQA